MSETLTSLRTRKMALDGDARETKAHVEPLPSLSVSALADPQAYPHDPCAAEGIELVQTHISHVFLTHERVYKLRKPVDLGFVSFSTRAERNADCLREVALNRRLAPDVYLGLAPLVETETELHVGELREDLAAPDASGRVPEHCVVMRRLPGGRDALSLLERGELAPQQIDAVAVRIAHFHSEHGLGVPAPFSADEWHARIGGPVLDNFALMREAPARTLPRSTLARAEERARAFLDEQRDRLEARRRAGRAVDGHGDLHLQHVWFERPDSEPLMIDCLEFRDDLRRIDAAADVAFLAMDLLYRRRKALAERFLSLYARESDDYALYGVVDFYMAYRAAVRAKVAAIAAGDERISGAQRRAATGSARRHLKLADRLLAAPGRGALLAVCGVIGTGKSSVAQALATELDGVVIASDRVRRRLQAPAAPEAEPPGWDEGRYAPEQREAVYQASLERAAPAVASGRVVILDASFAQRAQRDELREFARTLGLRPVLVEVRCAADTTRARLAKRAAEGRDPSEAGPELYDRFVGRFEPPREWPESAHLLVETDVPAWRRHVRELARHLRRTL